MKIHLITFATEEKHGIKNFYNESIDRLFTSSKNFGIDETHLYEPKSLPVSSYILKYMYDTLDPGFGFWSWKPIIILDMFSKINDGDVVIYHDAGRTGYNYEFKKNIKPLIYDVIYNYNGVGVAQGYWKHKQYCKRECFVKMECDSPEYWELDHAVSTWHIWQKNELAEEILIEWKKYCFDPSGIITNEIDETLSNITDDFVGHRHDQSILTNLIQKYHLQNRGINFLKRCEGWEKDINNYANTTDKINFSSSIDVDTFLWCENYTSAGTTHFFDTHESFEYSLVMPIHNQAEVIVKNLTSIVKNTTENYELILILDNCTDNTQSVLMDFINSGIPSNLKKIKIITSKVPLFETTCDNIGFKLSEGTYIIEIQSDMKIFTYGYNVILTKPFRKYPDVISVSGRCVHNLKDFNTGVGKLGALIENPLPSSFDNYNKFYVGDTCNRGPWALEKEKLKQLNYLDEKNFVLGDDDHDLNARGKITKNWICGYVPIEFKSNLSEGTTRKPRDEVNTNYLEQRRKLSDGGVLRKIQNGEMEYTSTSIHTRDI